MSLQIAITLTPQAEALVQNAKSFPTRLPAAMARTLDQQNLLTVSHIQKKYLSFSKSGPTTSEGLRAISTPGFRGTLRASKASIIGAANGQGVSASIGSNITKKGFSYPALHEFGGIVHHPARTGSVRLRTTAGGNILRQPGRGGAMFAGKRHTRFKVVQYQGKAYNVTYPARAPIRRGIADRKPDYTAALSATVVKTFLGKDFPGGAA